MTQEIPTRHGNAHPVYAPHNVYPAWGSDRWLALEIHSDEEFSILTRVIEQPEMAEDPRFTKAAARKQNETALDEVIQDWTRQRDRDWIVNKFNDAGLIAAPSRESRDLYADPHLRERGAFVHIEHPVLGQLELVRAPWIISDHPMPHNHAPLLGEHNEYVLGDLLQLNRNEIADLRETGIIL